LPHRGRRAKLPKPDVVTARALAPLERLLALAEPLLAGATALFPKGRTWSDELTLAHESWTFACDPLPSETDREGRILRITQFAGRRVHLT
jgi:16S rRNA (guanine527-N7)-methyltransferase